MRVLFFCPMAINGPSFNNGGGWVFSLINSLKQDPDFVPIVAFWGQYDEKGVQDGIEYYQIKEYSQDNTALSRIIRKLQFTPKIDIETERKVWRIYETKFAEIVDSCTPDIIHVFGSEAYYGLVAGVTSTPVLLHIQGILAPCYNAILPPGYSWDKMIKWYDPRTRKAVYSYKNQWELGCFREKEILKRISYYIGRTAWDKAVINGYHTNAHYYHVDEILRDTFYEGGARKIPQRLTIISTISDAYYKGFDMILKTASILKNQYNADFEWKVFGYINPSIMESFTGISSSNVNIVSRGTVTPEVLKDELLTATCYMHPSYIDNSPNSICEAQILGIPVITCHVGGISSLINHEKTGFIVPANDPYMSASLIYKLYCDRELALSIGTQAQKIASYRHDKKKIVNDLINVYKHILKQQ